MERLGWVAACPYRAASLPVILADATQPSQAPILVRGEVVHHSRPSVVQCQPLLCTQHTAHESAAVRDR